MMSSVMVSFVVPIFNVDKYLYSCLSSIESQCITDFEVLMIDDGSTDSSSEIAKKFLKDERFHYIYQKNAGVSAARNKGLALSKGKWIAFVDGDDSLTNDYLKILLENVDDDTDIVCCGCKYLKNGEYVPVSFYTQNTIFSDLGVSKPGFVAESKRELLLLLMDNQYKATTTRRTAIGVPWGKLYRASLLKDNNLMFNVDQKRLQDNIFNMYAFEKAGLIKYIDEMLYIYTVDHISTYRQKFDARAPFYYYLLFKLRHDFLNSRELFEDEEIKNAYYREVLKFSNNILKQYFLNRQNPNTKKEIRIKMREFFNDDLYTDVILHGPRSIYKIRLILARKGCYQLLKLIEFLAILYVKSK